MKVVGQPLVSDMDMGFGAEGLSTQLLVILLLEEVWRDGFSLSRFFGVFSIDGSPSLSFGWLWEGKFKID